MKKTFVLVIVIGLLLSGISQYIARGLEQQFPPIGSFASVNGSAMHYVERGVGAGNDKPAVIFIHGAGSNLRDLMYANGDRLTDQLRVLYVDRPGHGYSESFNGSNDVTQQAVAIAGLMDELKIPTAIIVGHSFGGSVASAFGVLYPEKTKGLVLIAQASHPWSTGITWYYDIASIPGAGWLFSNLLATPVGNLLYPGAVEKVFDPDPVSKGFAEKSGTRLVLRPANFHENAKDINGLLAHVEAFQSRYREITAPTIIFHGDEDKSVDVKIHSIDGMSKDIKHAELRVFEGMGHMPTHLIPDEIAAAVQSMAE